MMIFRFVSLFSLFSIFTFSALAVGLEEVRKSGVYGLQSDNFSLGSDSLDLTFNPKDFEPQGGIETLRRALIRNRMDCRAGKLSVEKCPSESYMEFLINKPEVITSIVQHELETKTHSAVDKDLLAIDLMQAFNSQPGDPEHQGLLEISRDMGYSVGVVAATLYVMTLIPDIWEPEHLDRYREDPLGNYDRLVRKTPVWDNDPILINTVGHGVSGYFYCKMAMNNLDPKKNQPEKLWYNLAVSGAVTAIMSTFYWEFGIEATIEIPSNWDLVWTPIVGTILCGIDEYYGFEKRIRRMKKGPLRSALLFVVDPLGQLTAGANVLVTPIYPDAEHGRMTMEFGFDREEQGYQYPRPVDVYVGLRYRIPKCQYGKVNFCPTKR